MSLEQKFTSNDGDEDREERDAPPQEPRELTVRDITEFVTPDHLLAISEASGGFSIIIDRQLGEDDPVGMTDLSSRVIRLNPYYVSRLPLKAIEGVMIHEAGHHAPDVLKLYHKMLAVLGEEGILPKELSENPSKAAEVVAALIRHLCNGLSDVWLESFMSRRPHYIIEERIRSFYESVLEGRSRDLRKMPKPEQLVQLLVGEDRYPRADVSIKDIVDSDVYEVYLRLKSSGAIAATVDRRAWEEYFTTEAAQEAVLARKLAAFRNAFLPAWLELFEAEAKRRKEQAAVDGKGEDGKGEKRKLTPKEIDQILKQLAEELEKLGEKYAPLAPSKEQKEEAREIIARIRSGAPLAPKSETEPTIGEDADALHRKWTDERMRGMAEGMGMRIETVRTWEEIREQRRVEIETAAGQIADVFLDDRRKRLEYMLREGMIVPGMEFEYVGAVISGDLAPQTHMRSRENPEFLETEVEFIQDVSGSMSGEPIRKCVELQIILAEAFKKVRQSLADEGLLRPAEEEPLRIGVTKFETSAERVKRLDEPMDDRAELKIIDELTRGGGGTDEEQALTEVYGELTLHERHILKIMIILSDGHGNKEAVSRIMRQIEDDDEIVVAVVGLGSGSKDVINAYTSGLKRSGEESNIHAFEVEDPRDLLSNLLEFFRREILKRRKEL